MSVDHARQDKLGAEIMVGRWIARNGRDDAVLTRDRGWLDAIANEDARRADGHREALLGPIAGHRTKYQ